MKIRLTSIQKYKDMGDICTSARIEIAWDDTTFVDLGLRHYESTEWELLTSLLILGGRRAAVDIEHKDLTNA